MRYSIKRHYWFRFLILGVSILVIISLSQAIFRAWQKRDIVKEKKQELTALQQDNTRLKNELEEAQSPAFIERQARDKLGLVKEGEVVVLLNNASGEASRTSAVVDIFPQWRLWWKLFF